MSDPTPAENHSSHQERLSPTEQFLENNFTKLLLLCAFVVIGLLAYGFVRYNNHQADIAAAEQFTAAKTIEDCDLVISQHSGTAAAGNARLLKADLLWEENKKDSSTSVLREFLKENEGHPLYATAMLGLASKLEAMGEKNDARDLFQRVSSEFPDSAVAPLARIRLGDLLWSEGKEDEAAEIYEGLATDFPDTNEPFYDQSQSRLEWLTAKLPTEEVEPPASFKAEQAAKKAAEEAATLPIGLKPPQINVDGTLGATISPDGGAMSPPVSPPPAPAIPTPAPVKDANDAAKKSVDGAKSKAKAKADEAVNQVTDAAKEAGDKAKSKAKAPAKKAVDGAKAKAADAKPEAKAKAPVKPATPAAESAPAPKAPEVPTPAPAPANP